MDLLGYERAMGKVIDRLDQRVKRTTPEKDESKSIPIPEYLSWLRFRPVVEKAATLEEVDKYYDLVDLLDLHAALDLRDEAEAKAYEDIDGS